MKIFENIKEFFFSADDDYNDQNDAPIRHDRQNEIDDIPVGDRRNKVVNIQTTAQLQVVLVKPEVFTDAKQIADHLLKTREELSTSS